MNPNPSIIDRLHPSLRASFVPLPDPSRITPEQLEVLFPSRLAVLREMVAHALDNQPITPAALVPEGTAKGRQP